jgi:Zn-dependent protease
MSETWQWLVDGSAWILPVVIAVTMHEAAHGWMAERYGDNTARMAGRVSFNPLKHIDRFGTIIFPGILLLLHSSFVFGYAKPVPVSFDRLEPQRAGMRMVALAGPMTNVFLAIISGLLLHIDALVTPEQAPWLFMNLYRSLMINCVLAVFNMIPILPLDGGRVVDSFLKGKAKHYYGKVEPYGVMIVLAAVLIPTLMGYNITVDLIGVPTFWMLEQVMWLTGNSE